MHKLPISARPCKTQCEPHPRIKPCSNLQRPKGLYFEAILQRSLFYSSPAFFPRCARKITSGRRRASKRPFSAVGTKYLFFVTGRMLDPKREHFQIQFEIHDSPSFAAHWTGTTVWTSPRSFPRISQASYRSDETNDGVYGPLLPSLAVQEDSLSIVTVRCPEIQRNMTDYGNGSTCEARITDAWRCSNSGTQTKFYSHSLFSAEPQHLLRLFGYYELHYRCIATGLFVGWRKQSSVDNNDSLSRCIEKRETWCLWCGRALLRRFPSHWKLWWNQHILHCVVLSLPPRSP